MRKFLDYYMREFSVARAAARMLVAGGIISFAACSGSPAPDSNSRSGSDTSYVPGQNRFTTNASMAPTVVAKVEPRTDSAAAPAAPTPIRHTSDTDKDFLHHMLDHYEAVLVLVHADMMKPDASDVHRTVGDPVERDAALDAEKNKMLQLLRKLYGESYSPLPVPAAAAVVAERGNAAIHASLATHFRAGVALVDRSAGGLRRPEVRALATQMRATQLALLKITPDETAPRH